MRTNKFIIYVLIEILLFIALLISQIIYVSNGHLLNKNDGESFLLIAILHISLTIVTFIYAVALFCLNRNKNRIREDLFVIYFLFALIADVFFSFTQIGFMGHIFFILSYLLFMFIRKAKIYEYIIVVLVGLASNIILIITNKMTINMGLDSYLLPLLLLNMIMCIINYVKNKNKANLIIMVAFIMVFISDASIGLGGLIKNSGLINTVSFMVWPTYIIACVLINKYYELKRE